MKVLTANGYVDVDPRTYEVHNTPAITIDNTTKEDGTVRQYKVREAIRYGGRSVTVSATSRDEAKEIAREQHYLIGKLIADVQ